MFQYFDLDNIGAISDENIKETFARCGNHITKQQVRQMIKDLDPNANMTEVTLESFINLMSEENFVNMEKDSVGSEVQSSRGRLGEGRKSTNVMQNLTNHKASKYNIKEAGKKSYSNLSNSSKEN